MKLLWYWGSKVIILLLFALKIYMYVLSIHYLKNLRSLREPFLKLFPYIFYRFSQSKYEVIKFVESYRSKERTFMPIVIRLSRFKVKIWSIKNKMVIIGLWLIFYFYVSIKYYWRFFGNLQAYVIAPWKLQ